MSSGQTVREYIQHNAPGNVTKPVRITRVQLERLIRRKKRDAGRIIALAKDRAKANVEYLMQGFEEAHNKIVSNEKAARPRLAAAA